MSNSGLAYIVDSCQCLLVFARICFNPPFLQPWQRATKLNSAPLQDTALAPPQRTGGSPGTCFRDSLPTQYTYQKRPLSAACTTVNDRSRIVKLSLSLLEGVLKRSRDRPKKVLSNTPKGSIKHSKGFYRTPKKVLSKPEKFYRTPICPRKGFM